MPWDTALAVVEKLFHWLSPRFMCFVFILCGGLFFIPPHLASYLSIQEIITAHRGWWALGMVVSAAYLIPFGVSPFLEKQCAQTHAMRNMNWVMSNLAQEEKRLLRRFYFPTHTGHLIVWRHEVGKLESDGVVFCLGDSRLTNRQEVFALTRASLKYIENHKEFIVELEQTPHF